MPSVLSYWSIRGLCQPIRNLLHYVGEEYEDDMRPADYDKWLEQKYKLGLDFPNLPYYIDDKVKLSQSVAILRYLGHKYKLCGESCEEITRIDLLLEQSTDFRQAFAKLCYDDNFETLKSDYIKSVPQKLKEFEAFLGDRPFAAGEKVTIADFHFHEGLLIHLRLIPDCLKQFPKLEAYYNRFMNLPKLKEYINSPAVQTLPLNWETAIFGNK